MAAKRCDALLVVDQLEQLCGIITDKDLTFRVVAEGLDVNTTKVHEIMTKNVQFANAHQTATEALTTMITGGFRHLPVMDNEGDVVGVLDITKCLYDALFRLEKLDRSSKKITEALNDVQKHFEDMPPMFAQQCEAMRQKLLCPDLRSITRETIPPEVSSRATVREAAKAMRQAKSTAVLIFEEKSRLAGIFTSKDVVLRVVAVKSDPSNTSIIRVMTPHPDSVSETTSVFTALRMMHDNHYLHLPVTDDEKKVIGLIDVLHLSHSVLEKINSMREGPQQTDFWTSTYIQDNGFDSENPFSVQPSDSASMVSESQKTNTTTFSHVPSDPYIFAFKFRDPVSLAWHRVTSPIVLSSLLVHIQKKCSTDIEIERIFYTDEDDDTIALVTDADLMHAVAVARENGVQRLLLSVQTTKYGLVHTKQPVDAASPRQDAPKSKPHAAHHSPTFMYIGFGVAMTLSIIGLVSLLKR